VELLPDMDGSEVNALRTNGKLIISRQTGPTEGQQGGVLKILAPTGVWESCYP